MSKTKIVVLQKKELIYTGIFAGLILLFIILALIMFHPKSTQTDTSTASYTPGTYTTELTLNDTRLNLEVVVDENHINGVSFQNIDESVTTMYPLLEPALAEIEKQLQNNVELEELAPSNESKYTQTLLIDAIKDALKKASNPR